MARHDTRLCLNSATSSFAGSQFWNLRGRTDVNFATAGQTVAGANEDRRGSGVGANRKMDRQQAGLGEAMARIILCPSTLADRLRPWTVCGHFASAAAVCSRTIKAVACARPWIVRDSGLFVSASCSRLNPGRGVTTTVDCLRSWTRTGRGHGLTANAGADWTRPRPIGRTMARIVAAKPQLIRGRQNLGCARGEASTL